MLLNKEELRKEKNEIKRRKTEIDFFHKEKVENVKKNSKDKRKETIEWLEKSKCDIKEKYDEKIKSLQKEMDNTILKMIKEEEELYNAGNKKLALINEEEEKEKKLINEETEKRSCKLQNDIREMMTKRLYHLEKASEMKKIERNSFRKLLYRKGYGNGVVATKNDKQIKIFSPNDSFIKDFVNTDLAYVNGDYIGFTKEGCEKLYEIYLEENKIANSEEERKEVSSLDLSINTNPFVQTHTQTEGNFFNNNIDKMIQPVEEYTYLWSLVEKIKEIVAIRAHFDSFGIFTTHKEILNDFKNVYGIDLADRNKKYNKNLGLQFMHLKGLEAKYPIDFIRENEVEGFVSSVKKICPQYALSVEEALYIYKQHKKMEESR